MPKILNISQVKKLTHDDKKLKNHSIDSTCSLYLACFDNGTKIVLTMALKFIRCAQKVAI